MRLYIIPRNIFIPIILAVFGLVIFQIVKHIQFKKEFIPKDNKKKNKKEKR